VTYAHVRPARGLFLSAVAVALFHVPVAVADTGADEGVLLIPDSIEVLKVNGKKPGLGENLSLSRKRSMVFGPGPHTLVVRYCTIYDVGEDFEYHRSAPVTLTFEARRGSRHEILHEKPAEKLSPKDYPKDVRIWIETREPGQAAPGQPAPAPPAAAPVPAASRAPVASPGREVPQVRPLDMLKVWWSQAGEEERAAFRRWIE
jgi:uncharacterized protein YccT (UPF0319 family)